MVVRIEKSLVHLLVPLEQVHQHPDNPNNGDLDGLVESIQINGFYSPIIVNGDGEIIAGNHRYQAMLSLGATHIPAIRVEGDREADLRRMLADNKITRNGWDDESAVLEILSALERESPIGIEGTGWDEADMARMMAEAQEPLSFGSQSQRVTISVTCDNIDAARDLGAELIDRGYEVYGHEV